MQDNEGASARDCGFLMFLTVLNVMHFVDRQLLASFANWMVPGLDLASAEFGLLPGLIFIVFYSVAWVFLGGSSYSVQRAGVCGVWG